MTPITEQFNENIDLILSSLSIDYSETGNRYFFPCPIHGSDNYSSLTIYKNGKWRCFTRSCHERAEYGIIGFVMAVMKCSREKAIQKCMDALNLPRTTSPKKYINYPPIQVPRSKITPLVNGNIEFYLRRGYSQEILQRYDVFICTKKRHHLYGRVVFPIYESTNDIAVGFVGRTLQPQCTLCNKYHVKTQDCPVHPYDRIRCEKWLNSRGFARNKHLFNYWYAKEQIEESGDVILVEGQGDVLKLEMAGIHNSLGIFGLQLTEPQINLLDILSPRRLYIATDNDIAGQEAVPRLVRQLKSRFNTIVMKPTQKDFGDMTVNEIKEYFNLMRNE